MLTASERSARRRERIKQLGKKLDLYLTNKAEDRLQEEIDKHPQLNNLTPVAQRSMYLHFVLLGEWPEVDTASLLACAGKNLD